VLYQLSYTGILFVAPLLHGSPGEINPQF
jgi:hypothetical protein